MATYGVPLEHPQGAELAFPDFTLRFEGRSQVQAPVTATIQKWHFVATAPDGTSQPLVVTSVQRPPAPLGFTVRGAPYTLATFAMPDRTRLPKDHLVVFPGRPEKVFD